MDEKTKRALDAAVKFIVRVHPQDETLRALKIAALDAIHETREGPPSLGVHVSEKVGAKATAR